MFSDSHRSRKRPKLKAFRGYYGPEYVSLIPLLRYDWLSHDLVETITEVQDFATRWLWTYSNERPHMALGGITPKQKGSHGRLMSFTYRPGYKLGEYPPYDGDTLAEQLEQTTILMDTPVKTALVDLGYNGREVGGTRILHRGKPKRMTKVERSGCSSATTRWSRASAT